MSSFPLSSILSSLAAFAALFLKLDHLDDLIGISAAGLEALPSHLIFDGGSPCISEPGQEPRGKELSNLELAHSAS